MYIAGHEENKACYGYDSVNHAIKVQAIQDLLISDSLYRSFDPEKWNKYVSLVAWAKGQGAEIHHLSSSHAPGERLDDMTGVGAILRYEVPGIMDTLVEEDEHPEEEKKEEENDEGEVNEEEIIESLEGMDFNDDDDFM